MISVFGDPEVWDEAFGEVWFGVVAEPVPGLQFSALNGRLDFTAPKRHQHFSGEQPLDFSAEMN